VKVLREGQVGVQGDLDVSRRQGLVIGSLCVIDTRPRSLDGPDLARLRDLAALAVQEIHGMNAVKQLRP
jgi:hypothetical protein